MFKKIFKDTSFIVHDKKNIKGFFYEYRWLSNFEPSIINYEGLIYPSVENAYQSAKCKDINQRKEFIHLSSSESKKLGRKVEIRSDWDQVRLHVMYDILVEKFKDAILRKKLLDTENKYLEETNYWKDTFFGVCNGIGENNLGKILMDIRNKIKVVDL